MNRSGRLIALSSLVSVFAAAMLLNALAYAGEVYPGLKERLEVTDPMEFVRVLIFLEDRVDVYALEDRLVSRGANRRQRHEAVVLAVQEKAATTQVRLRRYLRRMSARGEARNIRPFWIANMIAAEVRARIVETIAARSDVLRIYEDYEIVPIEPIIEPAEPDAFPGEAEPGLVEANAPPLWAEGIIGEGTIVMNIDTGVDGNHPAFAGRWRGAQEGVEWWEAWFNPDNPNDQFPHTWGSHGTHTMGTMTGLQESNADTIGMAFGAQWIACGAFVFDLPIEPLIENIIACFEWAADPDGNPVTYDDVPDVINNSWGVRCHCWAASV